VVLDGSGFSRKSRIFAGNIGEAETLQEMIEALADTDPVAKGRQSEIPCDKPEPSVARPLWLLWYCREFQRPTKGAPVRRVLLAKGA